MTEEQSGSCVLCWRRDPYFPPACDLCRSRLASRLWELRDLASLLPAALSPGRGEPQRVSGTRDAPLPLRVGALDRAAPARDGSVQDHWLPKVRTWFDPTIRDADGFDFGGWHRELLYDEAGNPQWTGARDQDGTVSVAAVLDSWARDWSETLDLPLPAPEVPALVSWLTLHLPLAVDRHPAIEEFASEVTSTLYAVRALLNVSKAPIYLADACPSCKVAALKRFPGEMDVECGNCHQVMEFVGLPIDDATEEAA